jgi:hypothetical protein
MATGRPRAPKNPSRAGVKSPEVMPCRYSNGSASTTFGEVRHHGGTIELRSRTRSPADEVIPMVNVVVGRRHARVGVLI